MNKYRIYGIRLVMSVLCTFIMVGCLDQELPVNDEILENGTEQQRIVIDLDKETDSRIDLSQGLGSIKSVWEEGDGFTLRVIDNGTMGYSKYFYKLEEGAGTSKGVFVGPKLEHKEGRTYRIYYPFTITNNTEFNEQVSLRDQVQDGDGSMAHLAGKLTMRHTVGHYSDICFSNSDYTTKIYDETKEDYVELSTSGAEFRKGTIIKIDASNIPVDFQPVSLKLQAFDINHVLFYDTNNTYNVDAGNSSQMTLELKNFDKDKDLMAYMMLSYKDMRLPEKSGFRLTITDENGASYYTDKYLEMADTIPGGSLLTLKYSDGWKEGNNYKYTSTDFSADGQVVTLQKSTVENGVNIVFMGDGFSDRQIADQTYDKIMNKGSELFFSIEPYKSFRHLFNVYYVVAVSKQEGCYAFTVNNTSFETSFMTGTLISGNDDVVRAYTRKVPELKDVREDDLTSIVLMNSSIEAGTAYLEHPMGDYQGGARWGQGYSTSYVPIQVSDIGFMNVLNHEAGGHGFGKLCDEYDHGGIPKELAVEHHFEWYLNVDDTNDPTQILWKEFYTDIYISREGIGAYEGANSWLYGYYRPTYNSIMRSYSGMNVAFNAPSRKAIYVRMHKLVYGEDWTWEDHKDEFFAWDAQYGIPEIPTAPETASSRSMDNDMEAIEIKLPPLASPVIINSRKP